MDSNLFVHEVFESHFQFSHDLDEMNIEQSQNASNLSTCWPARSIETLKLLKIDFQDTRLVMTKIERNPFLT